MKTHYTLVLIGALLVLLSPVARGQTAVTPLAPTPAPPQPGTPAAPPAQKSDEQQRADREARRRKAAEQLKLQEKQRMLGFIPQFNSANLDNALPLTPAQKFQLALHSAVDPFQFASAGVDSAISQLNNEYPEYGQGVEGYAKRIGASYADAFDGTILGNAVLPILFKEDPRYFRKVTGSVKSRLWYAALSTVRARSDSRHWVPNYGNLLGNLAAGGISNFYYPASDRGVGLTFQRAFTVTAEGAIGAVGYEFWPDIVRHYRKNHPRQPVAVVPPK